MKALPVIGVFFLPISILVMAILGYACIFYNLNWLWFFVILGISILSIVLITSSKMDNKYGVYYEALGGGFGWIWMLSVPANIWFFIDALFLEGAWTQLIYGVLVGGFAKAMLRGTMQAKSDI